MQMDEELGDLTTAESISIVTAKGNALFRFHIISPIHTSKQCTRFEKKPFYSHGVVYIYIISNPILSFFSKDCKSNIQNKRPTML